MFVSYTCGVPLHVSGEGSVTFATATACTYMYMYMYTSLHFSISYLIGENR